METTQLHYCRSEGMAPLRSCLWTERAFGGISLCTLSPVSGRCREGIVEPRRMGVPHDAIAGA